MARTGRIQVWFDCDCGAEVVVFDAEDGLPENVTCETCGRVLRYEVDVSLTVVVGPLPKED